MPEVQQTDTAGEVTTASKPARARKLKRKASEVTIDSIDGREGSPVSAPLAKKAKTAREKKERITKEKKDKAVQIKAEKNDDDGTYETDVKNPQTSTKRVRTASAKAAVEIPDDSALEAASGPDVVVAVEEDADFELEDTNAAEAADSKSALTTKIKSEPKAKPSKPKASKTKVEKPKVEKAKTTKDIKDNGVRTVSKDKKDKVEAVTGDAAVKLLLDYLTQQNRPYNGTDIITNLHGKVKKTLADKLLQEMANNGQIMGKHTGKTWIFWCIQKVEDAAKPDELAVLDTTISQLRETIPSLKVTSKNLTTQLQALKSIPTTSELRLRMQTLEFDKKAKQAKLQAFKEGKVKKIEKFEMDRVEAEWAYWSRKAIKRKRCFEDIEYILLAGMTKEDIWDKYDRNLATKRALRLMVSRAGIEGEDDVE